MRHVLFANLRQLPTRRRGFSPSPSAGSCWRSPAISSVRRSLAGSVAATGSKSITSTPSRTPPRGTTSRRNAGGRGKSDGPVRTPSTAAVRGQSASTSISKTSAAPRRGRLARRLPRHPLIPRIGRDIHGWVARDEDMRRLFHDDAGDETAIELVTADAEANERGQMIQKTAAKETFGDLIEDGKNPEDAPTIHDLTDAPDPTADAAVGYGQDEPTNEQPRPSTKR